MIIHGWNKTTLLDYPEHLAATVFTGGCNFRCPFCHNAGLVLDPGSLPEIAEEEVLNYLRKRQGILQGICITGGEPTLQPDLAEFIRKVKELGYLIKLDTNGSRPEVLQELLAEGMLDYVAMDIKASRENYINAAGVSSEQPEKSVVLLQNSGIPYEFRTTVVKGIHRVDEFESIGEWLSGSIVYYLQAYRENDNILAFYQTAREQCGEMEKDAKSKEFKMESFAKTEMEQMADLARKYIDKVEIRGLE